MNIVKSAIYISYYLYMMIYRDCNLPGKNNISFAINIGREVLKNSALILVS